MRKLIKRLDDRFIGALTWNMEDLLGSKCKVCGSQTGDAGCVPCNNHALWGDKLPNKKDN